MDVIEKYTLFDFADKQMIESGENDKFKSKSKEVDLIALFDNIEIKNSNRLSNEDLAIIEELQNNFNKVRESYKTVMSFLRENPLVRFKGIQKTPYAYVKTDETISSANETFIFDAQRFVNTIYGYFNDKYHISLENNIKLDISFCLEELNAEVVLEDMFNQLGGLTFEEKSLKEIKDKLREEFSYYKKNLKGKNFTLESGIVWEYTFGRWGSNYNAKVYTKALLESVSHFESGSRALNVEFKPLVGSLRGEEMFNENIIKSTSKLHSIKFFKNGKIQLKFKEATYALEFARLYCDYNS